MVGTILRYTWGHGQTNIEFFQVTRRTKASVWIKPLEREKIRERGMCGIFAPIPEAHNDGLVARKLIQQGAREYVVMDYGFAWPVNAEDVHFASWWN